MRDSNGRAVTLGDRVKLWEQKYGTIVCDFDERRFSEKFSPENWGYLKVGVLIQTDSGEVFHYEEGDEDFEIITPAGSQPTLKLKQS